MCRIRIDRLLSRHNRRKGERKRENLPLLSPLSTRTNLFTLIQFEPHKDDIVAFPVSYIYPVLILIILSFPPLGGHEIVLLVVGLIWGVWIGFAIACAGTWIGEMLCFFLFKYLLSKKAQE